MNTFGCALIDRLLGALGAILADPAADASNSPNEHELASACIRCQLRQFRNKILDFSRITDGQPRWNCPKGHVNKIKTIVTAKSTIRHFQHQLHAEAGFTINYIIGIDIRR
jgi:hypothetical protein